MRNFYKWTELLEAHIPDIGEMATQKNGHFTTCGESIDHYNENMPLFRDG